MKDYTRDPSSGEVWYKGRWYEDTDELEAAEAEYEQDQERKAEANREMRGSEDRLS